MLCATTTFINCEEKWKWQTNSRRTGGASGPELRQPGRFQPQYDYLQNRPQRPQYEVSEIQDGLPSRPFLKPSDFRPPSDYRPDYDDQRPLINEYPPNNRPNRPYRPNRPPPRPNPAFTGDEYPPANGGSHTQEVLTGPVPSWEQNKEPVIKNYDRCKCAAKFNCNTPGISFGHCDVGKQYCCYNSKGDAQDGIDIPHRPAHSQSNHRPNNNDNPGVLVGPGGPTGIIGRPSQNNRPHNGDNPGVLVGPGGPTGIIGRPPKHQRPLPYPGGPNTPLHSAENGILVGPGGPFDQPLPQNGPYQQRPYRDRN